MTSRKTVLVLDDEVIVAIDLGQALGDEGYDVIGPFYSKADAMTALDSQRPQVGILDINLGRKTTSYDVADRLSEIGSHIVFLTGYDMAQTEIAERFPQADVLPKPVEFAKLFKVLKQRDGQS